VYTYSQEKKIIGFWFVLVWTLKFPLISHPLSARLPELANVLPVDPKNTRACPPAARSRSPFFFLLKALCVLKLWNLRLH
jgi:hypothetical protein